MTCRWLPMVVLLTLGLSLTVGCEEIKPTADDLPPTPKTKKVGEPETSKDMVARALQVAKDEPRKAMEILETALKTTPGDREALLLLGVVSTIEGENSKEKAERIALFHKAFGAATELKKYPDLKPNEKRFIPQIELAEARALALEGKPEQSLAIIKALIVLTQGDFDWIEDDDDFKTLKDMPEFRTLLDETYGVKLAGAMKEVASELAVAKSFPFDFRLKDLDDKFITMADYRGKLTIVDLWGTWCPPCRMEVPHFVALYKKYKDKGLEIIGINCNEEGTEAEIKKTITEFNKANKIEYKCVLSDDVIQTKIPGFEGFPTTLFIDGTGKVRMVLYMGAPKAKLEAIVATLLAEGAAKAP